MRTRKTMILLTIFMCGVAIFWGILYPERASSGPYLNSTHGNTTYGVDRTSLSSFGYSKGNCAHCHEQHAMIGGSEPAPAGGSPSKYALFYDNHVTQTDNFCFKCHTDISSYQTGGLVNRSYSYRAGGYNDGLNDILEAFSNPPSISSHNLDDISTFINTKSWGYTNDSNPCASCHNPHMALGDPANLPNNAKSGTRGYSPVSRPSLHSKDNNAWGLWGDNIPIANERMSNYTANYQSPYRSGGVASGYEPDGSATQDGSNLTDYVTFCTDCHNISNTIWSTTKGRNLRKFDWALEKHGNGNATDDAYTIDPDVKSPYLQTTRYVLACTDCHEPHGSPNVFLLRKEVNNSTVTVTNPAETGLQDLSWRTLCYSCHFSIGAGFSSSPAHHVGTGLGCLDCHHPGFGDKRLCLECHYHGSTKYSSPLGPMLYKGGEHLF